jgi:hypothetical protein
MLAAWVTAGTGFMAGWLMCVVFFAGKLEDEYWKGFKNGEEYAVQIMKAEELNHGIKDNQS